MRLHHLALTAFGPFAGSEEVDLDALASSGLFLIHGPTGAGKSSILDAICFALYAAVPGARAVGGRASLRSDHAGEGVTPEVTLEFTASGRRLRVCRSPEFSRAKKRGVGETTVPARVLLEECTDRGWVCLGTRNDEVAMVLKDILGIGLEQFVKVVLLPQGDFAAFLRASPEQRRSVLEKLFDTQRFTDVESWLAERRRESTLAVAKARDALSTGLLRVDDVIARLDDGGDIIAPDWPSECGDARAVECGDASAVDTVPDIISVLQALATAVDVRAIDALGDLEVAQSALDQTESAVHHGAAIVRYQETAARARARINALDEQSQLCLDAMVRLDYSERAGAVSGFVATVQSANLTLEAAMARVANLREPLAHTLEHDIGIACVGSLIDQMAGQGDSLQQVVAQDLRASSLAQESARHGEAARVANEESTALALRRTDAELRRAAAEMSRDAGRVALAEIPALEARHTRLARILQLLDDQERSADNLEALQRQAHSAKEILLDKRELLVDLRERRLAGLAAELAASLDSGDPCPVCGSCVHPRPAITIDAVSSEDVRSAEAAQARASEALSELREAVSGELAGSQARAVELAAHAGSAHPGEPDQEPILAADDVLAAMTAAAAVLADARAAAAGLPRAQAQMAALNLEVEQLRVLVEGAVAEQASSLALAASTRVQSETAAVEVTRLLAGHGQACPCQTSLPTELAELAELAEVTEVAKFSSVSAVISWHRQTLERLRLLETGLRELVTHTGNARDGSLRLSAALKTHGLESMEQALAAVLSPDEAAELTALLRTAEQQRTQATALLAQPEVVAALTVPTPDMGALADGHREAARSLAEVGRRHTLSEQAQRELRALTRTVNQALADLGPAQQEAELVQRLADCAGGNGADNALRMRLSSYVLAARLAEIATLANERLTTMSDGRYSLEYSDARAARGARSGLGLLVRDAWTGQPRETSSLSGGEAFMASLALALGMGDAVRAEAGGFDLQTLFVDEGFGSLDEESLEQVMAVLDTLREGGRAVGIVSHVTELRSRIPHQLQVLKTQAGSRIHLQNRDAPAVNGESPAA